MRANGEFSAGSLNLSNDLLTSGMEWNRLTKPAARTAPGRRRDMFISHCFLLMISACQGQKAVATSLSTEQGMRDVFGSEGADSAPNDRGLDMLSV